MFAPTDEAFARLYADILDILFRDKIRFSDVLTHVFPEHITIEDALSRKSIKTANEQMLKFSLSNKTVLVDQVKILVHDILSSKGIAHAIDAVLIPEEYCTKVQLT